MRLLAALVASATAAALAAPVAAHAGGDWTWPVRGHVLTEFRNGDDPYAAGQHRGIDIAAPAGTPVLAATAGTVTFAGVVGTSGVTLSQRTADGRHVVSYLHLSSVSARRGETVAAGQRIGASGTSGTPSTGAPHLHLGVRAAHDRHAYVDPLRFLAPPSPPATQPRPVPVPAPAGEPARPAPAPAPAPAPVAQPAHAPAGVPALAPAPLPAARALPSPAAAPAAVAVGGAAATGAQPDAGPRPAAPAGPRPRRDANTHAAAHKAAPARGPRAAGAVSPPGPRPAPEQRRPSIAVGWLAACAGLICAAALLAGPLGVAGPRRPVRTAFGLLLRAASRG